MLWVVKGLKGKEDDGLPPIAEHVLLATVTGMVPWSIYYVNKLIPWLPFEGLRRMIKGRAELRQMAIDCVHDVIENKTDRKDLLGKLLEELKAGTDSTRAWTLTWWMFRLRLLGSLLQARIRLLQRRRCYCGM